MVAMVQKYTDVELLNQLQRCQEEQEKCTPRTFNQMEGTVSASVIMRRFDGWSSAKEEAGIDQDLHYLTHQSQEYSDEQILHNLRECARRNDGKCTVDLLHKEDDLVSASVAVERFGSWSEAKEGAGLTGGTSSNSGRREYSDEEYRELIKECCDKYENATL